MDSQEITLDPKPAVKPPPQLVHVGITIGYIGTPFRGSQLQTHEPLNATVEGCLLMAMHATGLISFDPSEKDQFRKGAHHKRAGRPSALPKWFNLGRTSRTDKGVHALRNVVTCFLEKASFASKTQDEWKSLLNDHLTQLTALEGQSKASALHVFALCEIPANFLPRIAATRRLYRYLLPVAALDALFDAKSVPIPGLDEERQAEARRRCSFHLFPSDQHLLQTETTEAAFQYYSSLALAFNEVASRFIGVHRFHNFCGEEGNGGERSSRTTVWPHDQEAVRRIFKIGIDPVPVMIRQNGQVIPYFLFQIIGNSFLLHMIRKILGCCIAICRGGKPSLVDSALSLQHLVDVPLAPGTGLLMHRPYFDWHDPHYHELKTQSREGKDRASHLISLSEIWQPVDSAIDEFEHTVIYSEIARVDNSGPVSETTRFCRLLRMHNWNVRPLPPTPSKPKVGEKRLREDIGEEVVQTVEEAVEGEIVQGEVQEEQKTATCTGGWFDSLDIRALNARLLQSSGETTNALLYATSTTTPENVFDPAAIRRPKSRKD